jgi:hypothetical protein
MILRSLLSTVPFVLCSLLAPDTGAPAGGNGGTTEPAPTPTPAPTQPPSAPEPEGDTLESKLESAKGHIGNLFVRTGELASQLATAIGERDRLQNQFTVAAEAAREEKKAHDQTRSQLQDARIQITARTAERDSANRNVERLENLCGVRGVDPNAAVTVPAEPAGTHADNNSPAGKWAQYEDLRKKEKTGTIAQGKAREFWTENKQALEKHAAASKARR